MRGARGWGLGLGLNTRILAPSPQPLCMICVKESIMSTEPNALVFGEHGHS